MTTKLVWSEATMTARDEAGAAIEKYLRSRKADMIAQNPAEMPRDELLEQNDVSDKIMSAWIVSAEFVNMSDMEESVIAYGNSGCTPATQQGLANYAGEDL